MSRGGESAVVPRNGEREPSSPTQAAIRQRIDAIRCRIETACARSGRDPSHVRIVAVSKGFGTEAIVEAVRAGIKDFGENYLQEAVPKLERLTDLPITWHFTGHVQRNKCTTIAERFSLLHGLDSLRLALALNEAGERLGRKIAALLQIKGNLSGYGFEADELFRVAGRLGGLPWLLLSGIMLIPPAPIDPEDSRTFFRKGVEIFKRLKGDFPETFRELSMGMTQDYEVAVEEGATLVRIGRGIFGPRERYGGR